MTQKDELLKDIFARIAQTSEESEDSHINMPSKSFSVQIILNQHGEIDIDLLIHFFEEKKIIVDRFFQDKNNVEKILFPFFDFLKYTFFSDNKIVPQHIIDILQKFPSVRDAVILYIQQKNKDITSSQHVEQYDTISFHLFLLGMDQTFDLVKDMQSDHFTKINGLFADMNSRVFQSLGVVKSSIRRNPTESFVRECYYCIELGETINVLALIHAVNFEECQISFQLGLIIRHHIDSLLRPLDPIFIEDHSIGKKLRYLSGRVQCNFAHGAPITGTDIYQVQEQISYIKQEQQIGFDRQRSSDFGGDIGEEKSSKIVLMGNNTIVELIGMERITLIQGGILPEMTENKGTLLNNLISIYNYGSGKHFMTTEEIINDFISGAMRNEYQIEVIYYMVFFDTTIKNKSIRLLADFFLNNKQQGNNFFYEEFVIKIIARMIRKFQLSHESAECGEIVDSIYHYLSGKNISYSILSYSQAYLSLALYYIASNGKDSTEKAKVCFLHYKNLSNPHIVNDKNYKNSPDEKYFYSKLGSIDEIERYKKQLHHIDSLEIAGMYVFNSFLEYHQNMAILSIEAEAGRIIASMNTGDGIYSQDEINQLLGSKISETIFYNLCTIQIISTSEDFSKDKESIDPEYSRKFPEKRIIGTYKTLLKRGFQKRQIPLDGGICIAFVYPSISEKIFEKIFFQQQFLMKERFGNLIAINNKNALLQKSKIDLEKLAFYDPDTTLPNANKLRMEIFGRQKTLVLIDVAGYENMIATQGGESDWAEIIKIVAGYLSTNKHSTTYRYDKTTFCLVYDNQKLANISDQFGTDTYHTIYDIVNSLLLDFHLEIGENIQFYAGVVVAQDTEQLKYAHIALAKAKNGRKKNIYVFEEGDEKAPEEIRHNTDILVSALDPLVVSTKIIPYYQCIYDPKNIHTKKYEALARIVHTTDDRQQEVIGPNNFIDIAIYKRWVSDITIVMLEQVILDMHTHPEIHVSINLHEQDWRDDRVMVRLRSLFLRDNIATERISIEILETIPFDRQEDRDKIKEIRSYGFKISIDDYGQDKSNLKKIMLIKPDNIKIDQDIIKALYDEEYTSSAIAAIRSVVFHAKEIGATVTAEYIETAEVYRILQDLGVDFFQGYYFSRPLPIANLADQT